MNYAPKTGPLHYCNKILQHTMKCLVSQHENVEWGHVASIITTKGIHLHGHTPRNIVSVYSSIALMKTLSAVRQATISH